MAYKPSHLANTIIRQASLRGTRCGSRYQHLEPMTHLKLQKLIYFINGWSLAITGSPVSGEQFEARPYGPSIGSLHNQLLRYGNDPLTQYIEDYNPVTHDKAPAIADLDDVTFQNLFTHVWNRYAPLTEYHLCNLANGPNTPWKQARDRFEAYLSDASTKSHFEELAEVARTRRSAL